MQRRLTHYRVPLFRMMRARLARAGIDLAVVYGDPTPAESGKADSGRLPWGLHVPCTYLFRERLCWQNAFAAVRGADLLVVTQENKLLFNYAFALTRGKVKMAYWGHGRNFQASNANSMAERFKRWLLTRSDWFFAYTDMSARVVVEDAGFPRDRVTVLNNAIDTRALAGDLAGLSAAAVLQGREELGIGPGPVGITLGSLYADKKIDFLLEAARRVRRRVPDFQLVIVGDGPQRDTVKHAVVQAGGWIHWLGARRGRDKALALRMATIMLNPGAVGLAVLDAFVARLPMVTSACGKHGPEIAYLHDGVNGMITQPDVDAYAAAVTGVLTDGALLQKLRDGCGDGAAAISLENMAESFCAGIERCLGRDAAVPAIGKAA